MRVLGDLHCPSRCPAKEVADGLLRAALVLDEGRPADDVTVVVLQTLDIDLPDAESLEIRRMSVSFPVSPVRWPAR